MNKIYYSTAVLALLNLQAEPIQFDSMSVTATKIERETKAVSQSIGVVDVQDIEYLPMQNITDALQKIPGVSAISKNGGYDTRIFIRGSGVKARYGVREIMVIRDGVPLTDPDSFTRFDFIDTQDIEQIEVTKGPGSIFASGSAGGTIQILSKSVFDEQEDRVRVGIGTQETRNLHFRIGEQLDDNDFISLTASHRASNPDWRSWNDFESNQLSFKHGHIFDDDATLETEISFSKADLQLPTSLTQSEFDEYQANDGDVGTTSDVWQHSGRYSEIWFVNSRYEKDFEDFTFKPQLYYNHWSHLHPVTFGINDSDDNNVFGTDLQFDVPHEWGGMQAQLVGGITARANIANDEKKYKYADLQTTTVTPTYGAPYERIDRTLSDRKGELSETSDSETYLYGFYVQEMFDLNDRMTFDVMARLEKADINIDGNEIWAADYTNMTYKEGKGEYSIDNAFTLASFRIGGNYALTHTTNVYATVGYSDQIPTESELKSNVLYDGAVALPELEKAKSTNYEMGLKHRDSAWMFDMAVYYTTIQDDITQVIDVSRKSYYQNAGEVEKKGLELQAEYALHTDARIGASYAYSDYTFKELLEYSYSNPSAPYDYSGNTLPLVPENQYTLYASYGAEEGFQAAVESVTWGSYYTDNANSAEYEGFKFVTNLMLGYKLGAHDVRLFINNLMDKQYAVEVKGDASDLQYTPAAPRTLLLSYTCWF